MSKEELYEHTFTYAQLRKSVEDLLNYLRSEVSENPLWAEDYKDSIKFHEDLIYYMDQYEEKFQKIFRWLDSSRTV